MFDFSGKVALVTGGSRGIGKATCEALAQLNAHVVINYSTNQRLADELVARLHSLGKSAESVGFDVSDSKAVEEGIAGITKRHGKLDILVANAGIAIDALLLRVSDEDLSRVLDTNVKGAIFCARSAVKPMMRARRGRIVFVSSVVGEMGNPGQTVYAASKAALLGITKTLAREYASRAITVNAVAPGLIETDMTKNLTAEHREGLMRIVPLGRTGEAREVASAIAFLCSDEASYITGHTLRVNGGML